MKEKAKQKRGQGEGTIRQRKDGRWEGRYKFEGKPKYVYGKTEEEVNELLKDAMAQIRLNIYKEPCNMLYSDWLEIWLWEYKHNKISLNTFEQYERIIRLYIKPDLGHHKLEAIKNHILQKHINKFGNTRNAQLIAAIIKMSFSQAVRADLIPKNPSEYVIIPKKNKRSMSVLCASEKKLLLSAVSGHRLGVAFLLLLSTGIRRGELLALKWQDVNWKARMLNVDKSLNRVKQFEKDKSGKYIYNEGATKNKKARMIPLLEGIVLKLKLHKNKQNIEKIKAKEYTDNNYIFCSKQGKPINPRNLTKYFYKFLNDAGIDKINLHRLRHTFATTGLEQGINMKVMQELLGHSSMNVTSEIYSHVSTAHKKQEMEKLKDAFSL